MTVVYTSEAYGNNPLDHSVYTRGVVYGEEIGDPLGFGEGGYLSVQPLIEPVPIPSNEFGEGRLLSDTLSPTGVTFISEENTLVIPEVLGEGEIHLPSSIRGYMETSEYIYPGAILFEGIYYCPVLICDQSRSIDAVLLFEYHLPEDGVCLYFQIPEKEIGDDSILDLSIGFQEDTEHITLIFKRQSGQNLEVLVDMRVFR